MSFNDLKIKQNHKDPQGFPQANIKPGPKLQATQSGNTVTSTTVASQWSV